MADEWGEEIVMLCRNGAGEVPFYSPTGCWRVHGESMIMVSLPGSYGVGEVIGRCAASLRSSRASLRGGWRLGVVGSSSGAVQLRRTATASPAATGHGRARERVSGVVRVEQRRAGAKGGPGEVCSVDGDGGAVACADGVHARDGVRERRGRVLVWEM